MKISSEIKSNKKSNKLLSSIYSCGLTDILKEVIDIKSVNIKEDRKSKKGYYITIIQVEKESQDIVDYFKERFRRRYPKTNKLYFEFYSNSEFGIIRFYYKANLFERSFI